MTTLKLHYDGWLALPAALRRKLGLGNGAALEIELVDGTIVLRPSSQGYGLHTSRSLHPAAMARNRSSPRLRVTGPGGRDEA